MAEEPKTRLMDFEESTKKFSEVLSAYNGVIVKASASWCGPCKAIAPHFDGWASNVEIADKDVCFVNLDVDENPEWSSEHGVSSLPTFYFFRQGEKVGSFSGANRTSLDTMVRELASSL